MDEKIDIDPETTQTNPDIKLQEDGELHNASPDFEIPKEPAPETAEEKERKEKERRRKVLLTKMSAIGCAAVILLTSWGLLKDKNASYGSDYEEASDAANPPSQSGVMQEANADETLFDTTTEFTDEINKNIKYTNEHGYIIEGDINLPSLDVSLLKDLGQDDKMATTRYEYKGQNYFVYNGPQRSWHIKEVLLLPDTNHTSRDHGFAFFTENGSCVKIEDSVNNAKNPDVPLKEFTEEMIISEGNIRTANGYEGVYYCITAEDTKQATWVAYMRNSNVADSEFINIEYEAFSKKAVKKDSRRKGILPEEFFIMIQSLGQEEFYNENAKKPNITSIASIESQNEAVNDVQKQNEQILKQLPYIDPDNKFSIDTVTGNSIIIMVNQSIDDFKPDENGYYRNTYVNDAKSYLIQQGMNLDYIDILTADNTGNMFKHI